jgi:alanine dehydrogenase
MSEEKDIMSEKQETRLSTAISIEGRKVIGQAIIEGLLNPSQVAFLQAGHDVDYDQNGGSYTQYSNGNYKQSGGQYTQIPYVSRETYTIEQVANILGRILGAGK